ncbi:Ku protein [Rhodococcus sp. ACPA4]|jgi:DNA end-binding protein Ku|uniref:non-homologous end joining protein Ku n=2 Tax=Rhodococcus TaxID=1827 RepID=UPI0005D34A9D|nr:MULTISPECIES: Ku protein [Rhodococcus]KJF22784.1 Ku protein [Rhodococcus sp. AD45]MDV8068248.1 Ku protein [Rhodococcus sp. IEGM 1366]NRI64561.1 Ku protein [Rhodococcus sp. MS16]PBC41071.1 Ku protein [Rhodococcus sp. ACPA4]PSR40344.1 Ku protein [Rhodococcus sp. AD45-ID]
MGTMRSIWKGSIAFGLVNVPVKVYSATEDHDIKFHQVHAKDGGRIKYNRVCSECGNTVQFADIDKAYDAEDGTRVVLTDEDFTKLPAAEKHEIPVLEFVANEQIDPILFEKSYFLEPDSASPKAYVLLSTVLTESDRTALVHFTLRQKTRLAALRARDGVLVIQTLLWPDEVRAAEFPSLDGAEKPKPKELKMAQTLVDSMAGDFDPTEFTDDYQLQLRELLENMIESGGKKVIPAAEVEQGGEDADVVDLVAALQRSVDEAKSNASKTKTRKRA